MIEVIIDSIEGDPRSPYRVLILKVIDKERYLPIWIGPSEAQAIAIWLQGTQVARPVTHDLLRTVIAEMGGEVLYILVNDLRNDTFYASIIIYNHGQLIEIDCRPSDAIALAVRLGSRIFVADSIINKASMKPEDMALKLLNEGCEVIPFGTLLNGIQ
jgi:bifunctional DNase/RNase